VVRAGDCADVYLHRRTDEDGKQMAQTMNGVTTEQTQGWGAQVMTNGPRLMLLVCGVLIGAFIAMRAFVGEFVDDPKVALAITAISCVFAVCVILAAPLIIWVIRETSKASVAGVSQQISETNQLVKSSIDQSSAVMSALVALTAQQMNQHVIPMQLPPAPQPAPLMQPAQAQIMMDGKGIDWDKQTVNRAAARIYHTLYSKRIEPTQSNIKDQVKDMQSTSLISAAMKELKALGWAESNGAGSAYHWIYDEAPANTDASPTAENEGDESE
jgi:hypothetical protein